MTTTNTIGRTILVTICTVAMSALCIVGAVGPAQQGAGAAAIAAATHATA